MSKIQEVFLIYPRNQGFEVLKSGEYLLARSPMVCYCACVLRLSDDNEKLVCIRYLGGYFTLQEIATQFNCTICQIGRILLKHDVPRNKKRKRTWRILPHSRIVQENRARCIERAGGLCEICGRPGKEIHHKDHHPGHNNTKNLELLCVVCHQKNTKKVKECQTQPTTHTYTQIETRNKWRW